MAAQYLLQKRSFDRTYSNPYRPRAAAIKYTPWKTISKHPGLEGARAAKAGAKTAGLVSYRICYRGQAIEDNEGGE